MLLNLAKKFIINSQLYLTPRYQNLVFKKVSYFSNQSQIKVFDMIKNADSDDAVGKILTQIPALNERSKETALNMIIQKVLATQIKTNVLWNERFNIHIKKYPSLIFKSYLIRIQQNMGIMYKLLQEDKIKQVDIPAKQINLFFPICFDILKKMPAQLASKNDIIIHKYFAHYHAKLLSKIIDPSKISNCNAKAKQHFKITLRKMNKQFKTEFEKYKNLNENSKNNLDIIEKQVSQSKIKKTIEELQQLAVGLGDTLSQIVLFQSQIEQKTIQQTKKQEALTKQMAQQEKFRRRINQSIHSYIHEIKMAVSSYESLKELGLNVQLIQGYIPSKKLQIEIEYQIKKLQLYNSTIDAKVKNDLLSQQKQKYISKIRALRQKGLDSIQKLQVSQENLVRFYDVGVSIASISLSEYVQQKMDSDQMSYEVGEIYNQILKGIEDKTLRYSLIKQLVQYSVESFGFSVSKHLEKVPRSFRFNRRRQ